MYLIIVLVIIYYVTYRLYERYFPSPTIDPNGKYVLITGCDTGFGRRLAIELDKQGFNVLAGVLIPTNVTAFKEKLSSKATVFQLDITKQEDIDAAYDLVKDKTNTLHGLVNNAGLLDGAYIDWTSMELLRKVMEVNFFGQVAMTKKFLPLLIAKRDSRVVNMSCISGFISLAGTASYSASKYALESFSDCLRREMAPWGLRVSIIEPGAMRTNIIESLDDRLKNVWDQNSSDVHERWGMDFLNEKMKHWVYGPTRVNAEDPRKVVGALQHAVMGKYPRLRYRPGLQAKIFYLMFKIIPAWIQDKLFADSSSDTLPTGVEQQLKD
jgi:NAD(P)-dependent dehydrogenase (short-subunit alcohol dehydrogenase family)